QCAPASGKSVCINAIIASVLYRFTPADLRLIMIDPKVVEMQQYNTLPHLVLPMVTHPKKVLFELRWSCEEMDKRYEIFAKVGMRNITTFNARPLPKTQAALDALAEGKDDLELSLPLRASDTPSRPPVSVEPELDPDAPTINFDEMSDDDLLDVEVKPAAPRVAV